MLYRADAILNQKVEATDGVVGVVRDLYFDDVSWTLRYLVVDTGGWLTGRDILISSESLVEYCEERGVMVTRLSQMQIENSPAAETGQPISRLSEMQLSQYYGWSPYWSATAGLFPLSKTYSFPRDAAAPNGGPLSSKFESEFQKQSQMEPNLRSFSHLKDYALHASDGDVGQVEDLLIEPETWRITHLIADTRLWWPGGLVVIDRALIDRICWPERQIAVSMTRAEVKNSPAYDRRHKLNENFQTTVSSYYRNLSSKERSHPWTEADPQS